MRKGVHRHPEKGDPGMIGKQSLGVITLGVAALIAASAGFAQDRDRDRPERPEVGPRLSMLDARFLTSVALANRLEIETGRLASRRGSSDAVRRFGETMARDHERMEPDLERLADRYGLSLPPMRPEPNRFRDRDRGDEPRDRDRAAPPRDNDEDRDQPAPPRRFQEDRNRTDLDGNSDESQDRAQAPRDADDDRDRAPERREADDRARPDDGMGRLDDLGLRYLAVQEHDEVELLRSLTGPEFDRAYLSMQLADHAAITAQVDFAAHNGENRGVRDWATRIAPEFHQHLQRTREIAGAGVPIRSERRRSE